MGVAGPRYIRSGDGTRHTYALTPRACGPRAVGQRFVPKAVSQAYSCYKMWSTAKLDGSCLFSTLEPFPRFGVSAWLCLLGKAVSWGPGVWLNPWVGLRAPLLGNLELHQIITVRTMHEGPERLVCSQRDFPHYVHGLNPEPGINECLLADCENVRVSQSRTALLRMPHILECSPAIVLNVSLPSS